MKLHQTSLQKEMAQFPTELDFRRISTQRGLTISKEDIAALRRLEAGAKGEEILVQKLEELGKSHWTIIRNLRLNNFSTFECDLLLLTNNCLYHFEVKHYTGKFTFDNGDSYYDDFELDNNIVQQTRSAHLNIKRICQNLSHKIKVKSILIFIGEDNQVAIKSEVNNIQILTRTDLTEYIKKIIVEENSRKFSVINPTQLIAHLEKYEVVNEHLPKPFTSKQLQHVRRGIYCSRCMSYDVKIKGKYVMCPCGLHEPREEAMIRTICEYGVLTYGQNLTKKELLDFIGDDTTEYYLKKILKTHFNRRLNGRYTDYPNQNLPFMKIHDRYTVNDPVIFYNERGFPDIYILNK